MAAVSSPLEAATDTEVVMAMVMAMDSKIGTRSQVPRTTATMGETEAPTPARAEDTPPERASTKTNRSHRESLAAKSTITMVFREKTIEHRLKQGLPAFLLFLLRLLRVPSSATTCNIILKLICRPQPLLPLLLWLPW